MPPFFRVKRRTRGSSPKADATAAEVPSVEPSSTTITSRAPTSDARSAFTVATITFLPFILNGSITTLTSLDFLGFGLPPGSASLGELLAQGKANLQAPWLALTGFLVLAVMLSLLIFVGEAVRDAFDPRKVQ